MGSDDTNDELGGPKGWENIANQPEFKDLRVNMSHFGGSFTKQGTTNQWTEDFAYLIKRAKNRRFYGDLGYWNELRGALSEAVRERLRTV